MIKMILGFLGISPFTAIASLVGVTAIISLATVEYYKWEHAIEDRALLKFNSDQQKQTNDDNAKLKVTLDAIAKNQDKILTAVAASNQEAISKLNYVQFYLSSDAAKKLDGPADEVIKQTIRNLKAK